MKKLSLFITVFLLAFFAANAKTYTVASTADAGLGSLRAAIDSANARPGLDSIVLNIPPNSVIYIQSEFSTLTDSLVISGLPCNNPTINGSQVILGNAALNTVSPAIPLTVNYINFVYCNNTSAFATGGAIGAGFVYLNNCYFHANTAFDNTGNDNVIGGAVACNYIRATNCTFDSNSVGDVNSFNGPKAAGGALFFKTAAGLYNCTFNNNQTDAYGGAIYGADVFGDSIVNCTFVNNGSVANASFGGGAIFLSLDANVIVSVIDNNICWGNTAIETPSEIWINNGTVTSSGCNILQAAGNDNNFVTINSDVRGVDPLLGTLANYGGCVPTIPIACSSVAVKHASCGGFTASDARGIVAVGGRDAGAFQLPIPVVNLGNDTSYCGSSVTLFAGNPGATYAWSNGSTADSAIVTTSGQYSVTVTNATICSVSGSVNVYLQTPPSVYLGPPVTQCGGTVTLDAGNPGYTYLWSNTQTTQTTQVGTTNTYKVTVTNPVNHCSTKDSVHITINAVPVVNLGPDQTKCGGSVTINAFQAGSTYVWSNGTTTSTLTVSSSGYYKVTVTNASNCSASGALTVAINPVPTVYLPADTTTCGTSMVLNAGSGPGYQYLWSDQSTGQTDLATHNGDYAVTVTNTNNCTASATAHVTLLSTPVVNLGPDVNQCGGTVTLNAGNNGDTYLWSSNATSQSVTVSTSGTYIVTVTDPSTCSATGSVQVYIKTLPFVNLGNDIFQCGGTVTLDAGNPGDIYAWSTTETTQTITVSSTNDYSVTVTDANSGCSSSGNIFVDITTPPVVDLGPNVTLCGGQDTLDAGNAGASYNWSTGATTQSIIVAAGGTYSVTVDAGEGGCTASATLEVYINSKPYVNLGNDTTQCGGSVTLEAGNPGDVYSWSNGATTSFIVVTDSNTYSVTVTDPNGGCSAADTVNVHVKTIPVVNLGPDVTQCGGSVTLYAGNQGASYLWGNGSTADSLIATTPGLYTVTVTNAANCSSSGSVNVYIQTLPSVYIGQDVRQCGGTVTLDAGNPEGYSFIWSTTATTQTIQVTTSNTYNVTVTSLVNGCSSSDTVNVIIDTIPVVNLGHDTTQCGGTVTLYAGNAGGTYLWSDNSVADSLLVSASGIYRLTVTTSNGCTATGSITVTIHTIPVVTMSLPVPYNVCITSAPFALFGGLPLGGIYYEADTVITVFNPVKQGIGPHLIKYVFANIYGCMDSDSATIIVRPQPLLTSIAPPYLCTTSSEINLNNFITPGGGVYTGIGVSGSFLYPNLVPPGLDTVVDIYTDNFGCMDTLAYPVRIHRPVHVSITSSVADFTICKTQSITFSASGAEFYQFFVNDTAQGIATTDSNFTTTTLTNHSIVYVVGSNPCSTDTSEPMVIDVITPPVVSAGSDTTITLGQTVQLHGVATGTGSLTYLWTPGNGLNFMNVPNPTYSGSDSITFSFKATDSYGCADSASVSVYVYVPDNVLLPNLITPNGDGYNDVWKLNSKINLDGSHLVIFDRWGQTVYETDNYANNWGGTYKSTGKVLPDDTYYYVLKAPNMHNHVYEGPINIISGNTK